MEPNLRAKIVESLVRDTAIEDLEKVARKVREVHMEMVQSITSFVRLCESLLEIKEEYGEEAFRSVLGVLGIKRETIENVLSSFLQAHSIPPKKLEILFKEVAISTVKRLGLIGGTNGDTDR